MADQKDQGTDPPAEKPASLQLKKRVMAEKSEEETNKQKLQEQIKAFYSILQAFTFETSTMSNVTKRTQIIEKLMKEWEIAEETHICLVDKIQKDLLILQQMEDSTDEQEMQIPPETPLIKPARPSLTFVPKPGKIWGRVSPESLFGKFVLLRLPDEDELEERIIKAYDAENEMHCLVSADSNAMEDDDPYSWIDLREIPTEDIIWEGEVRAKLIVDSY